MTHSKPLNSKKSATQKGDKINKTINVKGERARATTMKVKEINAEVDMVPFDAAEGEGSQQATRHRERYEARERGDLRHERPADDRVPQQKGGTTANAGTRPQQNIVNATLPDNKGTTGGSRLRGPHPNNVTRAERSKKEDMEATKPIQQQENNMEPKPDQLQQEEEWLGGRGRSTHLHLRYLAHGFWVGEVLATGSELTPPYGRVPGVAYHNVHDYNHYTLGQPKGIQKQKPGQGSRPFRGTHKPSVELINGENVAHLSNAQPEEQQFARGVLPRWRTGAEASPTAAITAGRGELRRINPAQMAATLVEVVRHILGDTLHATSVRNELSEVGELLEDVVADFGASIRLRDSAGIAEGRDALMEAVNILDEIVMNYDAAHDEFTMDPATLQDDLLRLAQQLQIVVPAHNNLLGDIRGELPSQRPSSNAQELYEGYGDELGVCPPTTLSPSPAGPDPAGDTEEGHRCALQLLSVLEREFPESYRSNGQCEADAIWLLLRGERLAEYIDGMNLPAEERMRGGQDDEHPGLRGVYQHHEGNARDGAMGRHVTQDRDVDRDRTGHPQDFEPTALMQTSLRGNTKEEQKPIQKGRKPHSDNDRTGTNKFNILAETRQMSYIFTKRNAIYVNSFPSSSKPVCWKERAVPFNRLKQSPSAAACLQCLQEGWCEYFGTPRVLRFTATGDQAKLGTLIENPSGEIHRQLRILRKKNHLHGCVSEERGQVAIDWPESRRAQVSEKRMSDEERKLFAGAKAVEEQAMNMRWILTRSRQTNDGQCTKEMCRERFFKEDPPPRRKGDRILGMVAGHVDDFLNEEDAEGQDLIRRMKEKFHWGDWDKDEFCQCGVTIKRTEEGFELSQPQYVAGISEIPVSANVFDKMTTEVLSIKGAEKRTNIVMISLKESRTPGIEIRWVHSEAQLANALTKVGNAKEMELFYRMRHHWRIVEDPQM
ncbi:hypothetical protein AK812_SmicGene45051, partial [Symbiodinium microadriaticum]